MSICHTRTGNAAGIDSRRIEDGPRPGRIRIEPATEQDLDAVADMVGALLTENMAAIGDQVFQVDPVAARSLGGGIQPPRRLLGLRRPLRPGQRRGPHLG